MKKIKVYVAPGVERVAVSTVLACLDGAGQDGSISVYKSTDGTRRAFRLNNVRPVGELAKEQFLAFCKAANVAPTSPLNRWASDYTGEQLQDDYYDVSFDEFRQFVEPFGVLVERAEPVQVAASKTSAIAAPADSKPVRNLITKSGAPRTAWANGLAKMLPLIDTLHGGWASTEQIIKYLKNNGGEHRIQSHGKSHELFWITEQGVSKRVVKHTISNKVTELRKASTDPD